MADEIQTGLGRTGRMFACDHEGIRPDIIIIGKALSGGFYPVSAIVADDEVLGLFRPGDHGSTFGGNPLASVILHLELEKVEKGARIPLWRSATIYMGKGGNSPNASVELWFLGETFEFKMETPDNAY